MEMVRRGAMSLLRRIFSRENMLAVAVCLIILLLIIVSTDSAPRWIYQGY